jgi:hypothetical protein
MIGDAETPLTLAGFIAIASLGIGAIGLALNATSKNNDLRERLTRLEQIVEDHIRNGGRHERG